MGTEPEVQGGPVGPAPAPAPAPAPIAEPAPAPMAEPSGGGMNMMKILAIVGAILLLVSFFLPMVSMSQMGVTVSATGFSATQGEATAAGVTIPLPDETGMNQVSYPIFYAVIIMGILALLFCFIPNPKMPLLAGIFGLIGLICAFVGYMALQGNMPAGVSWDMGYGLYIAIVGGILALIGGIIAWKKASAA